MRHDQPISRLFFKGTASWNSITHKADTAVIDNGVAPYWPHSVKFTTAAVHNLTAGSHITLGGVTTNYAGTYKILAVPTTTTLVVESTYIAETLTTTATFKFTLAPKVAFELVGFRLTLAAGADQTENLTVTLDSGRGSNYDCVLLKYDTSGMQHLVWQPPSFLIENGVPVANQMTVAPAYFEKDDEIDFAWANAGSEVYGLEVQYRRIG